ncbi:bifunctional acetate--CoA ligase family protein/GNAT family N-acetyltransferase [Aquibaculum arenosum]|uniref:Bifunctional acetate--CoA ligase family protein/GNAT family N-acetyltransferase n=1 Tax=Aquibaculum arenosum TaxID=3032591 RepID=A0ABT5YQ53_9PROT|nr:bifunctional acetate--CoA ligase family protein/GNAT family N-acetyltransferase [Fodinicurvata sp. CAU 1616]MDF2097112.1 bifunctional acetate--CoA ligase family protein/GNAT family N-acetyltransferase [Fodinicurvata sp. CAU 1616]
MTTRNLDALFKPRSIALIGASRREGSVGRVVARNLFHAGFEGPVMPVNPHERAIEGVLAYSDVAALPETPDLAIIVTPPKTVPGIVAELGARGTRGAVVVTAGFNTPAEEDKTGGQSRSLRQELLDAARPHTLRIAGPNCVGVMLPHLGVNGSFAHIPALPGDLAFVTQSGAMVTAMLDWATPRGIGFSHVVSLGDMADVDFGDMLDYLAVDPSTRAVLLYVEAVTDARKFMSAARACARSKPVIVIKGGRHAEGAKAATSHTGALAGADEVYDAAFRRAGALRVFTLEELFDAAQTLSTATALPRRGADKLAILTNGGGLGVLATDALIDGGGHLAELTPETITRLDGLLPSTWSRGNPVDIIGDAPGSRYAGALETLLEAREVDAVLAMHCPVAVADPTAAAQAVIDTLGPRDRRRAKPPVFTAWLGERAPLKARRLFSEAGMPSYDTPERAVRGFMHLVRYRRSQTELMETPPSIPDSEEPDGASVRALLQRAQREERVWLNEPEAKQLLAAYGIPVVATEVAGDVEAAVAAAGRIGYPVAIKILSHDITHKSDVGGVQLDLADADALRSAAEAMLERVRQNRPEARIEGFSVQAMARRPGAQELILGLVEDRQFGPVVLFGQGGTAVEVVRDKAVALPPLNLALARSLMAETRVYRLLEGYRDRPAADLDAIALALVRLAQLAADFADIAEVDINPLLADSKGVVALDARVRVKPSGAEAARGARARLAIRPYPKSLEQKGELRDGTIISIRPIRPEDEPALQRTFAHLTPEDVRMRFFSHMAALSHESAARLTQIDYNREMALVALDPEHPGEIWGWVTVAADPENRRAEYAVAVRSYLKGRGLGYLLMRRILAYAESCGIEEVWGDVLADNRRMLTMATDLGFTTQSCPDDPGVMRVVKRFG